VVVVQAAVAGGVALTADVVQPLEQWQELVEVLQAADVFVLQRRGRRKRGAIRHAAMRHGTSAGRNTERPYLRSANNVPNTIGTQLESSERVTPCRLSTRPPPRTRRACPSSSLQAPRFRDVLFLHATGGDPEYLQAAPEPSALTPPGLGLLGLGSAAACARNTGSRHKCLSRNGLKTNDDGWLPPPENQADRGAGASGPFPGCAGISHRETPQEIILKADMQTGERCHPPDLWKKAETDDRLACWRSCCPS
jgi:hypothetical protein